MLKKLLLLSNDVHFHIIRIYKAETQKNYICLRDLHFIHLTVEINVHSTTFRRTCAQSTPT
jgi:hypothetical protein